MHDFNNINISVITNDGSCNIEKYKTEIEQRIIKFIKETKTMPLLKNINVDAYAFRKIIGKSYSEYSYENYKNIQKEKRNRKEKDPLLKGRKAQNINIRLSESEMDFVNRYIDTGARAKKVRQIINDFNKLASTKEKNSLKKKFKPSLERKNYIITIYPEQINILKTIDNSLSDAFNKIILWNFGKKGENYD